MIANPIGRAIYDNAVFNCFGKHISPIANAVYILWRTKLRWLEGPPKQALLRLGCQVLTMPIVST